MSKVDIPEGFVMPTFESTISKSNAEKDVEKEDMDFWADSDVDEDPFGGSDSSDMGGDEDDDMEFLDDDDDDEDDDEKDD
jgi:ubiquitin-conjugating enzyme E2 R